MIKATRCFNEILITGIVVHGVQIYIVLNTDQCRHVIIVSFLQPSKNFIVLSESRISRRDYILLLPNLL
jgi:hypothetical protein